MFPCDRFGAVHIIRVIIEILLITFLHIFGSCRLGIIFGFNDTSSIIFSITIIIMASTDIYYLLLSLFTSETPRHSAIFHIIFYSCMSLLALICCVFSIVAYIYCVQNKYNRLCPYYTCSILWISITLTFLLTIMYSGSTKLLCCFLGQN
ncbi:unnamed protein product [Adineta steineri]|uniref:MARVEL domain-containing protein n=1 Tax=Adineta steineri TaxID=433720 RepID=A0A813N8K6_9BILA|nr:unnamed protein product [Adineta steineri]CAF0731981.1 unnamed protein product [Adineta steineri]CAF0737540.1 unnamed protein product [Adineta steineri]CAF0768775.1 unnamed protein product [Adineta steineri]CAF3559255.1 unnamed protein product [Adineta steineri]